MRYTTLTISALFASLAASGAWAQSTVAAAAPQAAVAVKQAAIATSPDGLIRAVSTDVLAKIKADPALQKGDINKISTLVESDILPHLDFRRMTASAVGRSWRDASPAQQAQLQAEFKTLLIRTYSGALSQVRNHTVDVKRLRANPADTEVIVKSELKASGQGQPVNLDYRLAKSGAIWRVYDVNVMGIWLIETYRADFASVVSQEGIDGLITRLKARNAANSGK